MPAVTDKMAFGSTWCAWWLALQPKWRQEPTNGRLPGPLSLAKGNDNLTTLKKGGASGLVTVLITLKWWAPLTESDSDWKAAVKDIFSCLEYLTDTGSGTKRKGNEENKAKAKKKKI
jgi:hypothetical protein